MKYKDKEGQELVKASTMAQLENYVGSFEQLECEVNHSFAEGMYIRTLHIPKGALIVGKRHRKKTMNILAEGTMTIYDGKETVTLTAPYMAESSEFTKKAGFAHTDAIWVNMHVTEETDLEKLEEEFIISEKEYKLLLTNKKKEII